MRNHQIHHGWLLERNAHFDTAGGIILFDGLKEEYSPGKSKYFHIRMSLRGHHHHHRQILHLFHQSEEDKIIPKNFTFVVNLV